MKFFKFNLQRFSAVYEFDSGKKTFENSPYAEYFTPDNNENRAILHIGNTIYYDSEGRPQVGEWITLSGDHRILRANGEIWNTGAKYVQIYGGSGNDKIGNHHSVEPYYAKYATIDSGAGNDEIRNSGSYVTISGGAGNDSICLDNNCNNVTADGGTGNDSISVQSASNISVNGGADNDSIYIDGDDFQDSSDNVTINGGDGKNLIDVRGYSIEVNSHVIQAGNDADSIIFSGRNLRVSIEAGKGELPITLHSSSYNVVSLNGGNSEIQVGPPNADEGYAEENTIYAGVGDDSVTVSGWHNTIYAGTQEVFYDGTDNDYVLVLTGENEIHTGYGNDTVWIRGNENTVDAGYGADSIRNEAGGGFIGVSINGGYGNDTIENYGEATTISAGDPNVAAGKNVITNYVNRVTISGGGDSDTITHSYGNQVSINGGAGNDVFKLYSQVPFENLLNALFNPLKKGFQDKYNDKINDVIDKYNLLVTHIERFANYEGLPQLHNIDYNYVGKNRIELKDFLATVSSDSDKLSESIEEVEKVCDDAGYSYLKNDRNLQFMKKVSDKVGKVSKRGIRQLEDFEILAGVVNEYRNDRIIPTMMKELLSDFERDENGRVRVVWRKEYYDFPTIQGGKGNDEFYNDTFKFHNYLYKAGDGNDIFYGWNPNDTLYIEGGSWSGGLQGNDYVVHVGSNTITFKDYNNIQHHALRSGEWMPLEIEGYQLDGSYRTTSNASYQPYYSAPEGIINDEGEVLKTADKFSGEINTIEDYADRIIEIDAHNAGDVDIIGNDNVQKITSGFGNDSINNNRSASAIQSGFGNDLVFNFGDNSTIETSGDDDTILSDGENNLIVYKEGDGKDLVYGFNETSTLSITGDGYNSLVSGSDVILGVGSDSITINGAASLESLNIVENRVISSDKDVTLPAGAWAVIKTGLNQNAVYADSTVANGSNNNDTIKAVSFQNVTRAIYGNGGNDKINLQDADYVTYNSTITISGGNGDDEIKILGDTAKNTEYAMGIYETDALIDAGNGNDTVNISAVHQGIGGYNKNSNVTIDGGNGNNFINVDGSIKKSVVSIKIGTGNDTVKLNGDDWQGIGNSTVTIDTGDGDDQVNVTSKYWGIDGGTAGDSHYDISKVTIKSGKGNDKIKIHGKAYGISSSNVLIDGDNDNDEINIAGNGGIYYSTVTAAGGTGADTINVKAESADGSMYSRYLLDGGAESDYINISGNTGIGGGSTMTAAGGAGNDTINVSGTNYGIGGSYDSIDGGDGDDLIKISSDNYNAIDYSEVTLNGGAGADTISVNGAISNSTVSIDGGAGADAISIQEIYNSNVTIVAGAGDNISVGSGNVTYLFDSTDAATINGVTFKASTANTSSNIQNSYNYNRMTIGTGFSGNITVPSGKVLFDTYGNILTTEGAYSVVNGRFNAPASVMGVAKYNSVDGASIVGTNSTDSIYNVGSNVNISTGSGKDTIYIESYWDSTSQAYVYPTNVTVDSGDGDDDINIDGSYSVSSGHIINAGAGNDVIWNYSSNSSINAGTDNDYIYNRGNYSTIIGGDGNDTIRNSGRYEASVTAAYGDYASILGGAGDDVISLEGGSNGVTVNGGEGNDSINNQNTLSGNVYEYNSGDGADIIVGMTSSDTLIIDGTTYSTVTSNNDLIVTAGDGAVTLQNAATLTGFNIVGTISSGGEDTGTTKWTINATTATYGTTNETLITITGLKDGVTTNDISLNGKTVTLKKAALGTNTVQLTGEGYTLALADDVTKPADVDATWSVTNGTATYKGGKTAGYTLSGNTVTYSAAVDGEILATVTGLKNDAPVSGIFTNGNVITLSASVLDQKDVTLIGEDYTLALANDVTKPADVDATWSVTNGTATYKGGKTAGYTLSGNKVTYSAAVDGEILATITGLKNDAPASGITTSGNVITLSKSVLGTDEVTLTGDGYTLALADDVDKPTSVTASWKVSDGIATYRGSTTAGYVVENNKVTYQAESYDEPIMTITGLSENTADSDISLSNGVLTLAANAIGTDTVTIEKTVGVTKISAGKAGNFLIGSQTFKTDTPVDFIINADGNVSAVELANMPSTTFTNSADNISIFGGTGNDVITSSGSNVTISGNLGNDSIITNGDNACIQYKNGDGDDVIVGFTENDVLKISDDMYNTTVAGNDLQVNLVRSHNTIILKDGANLTPNIEGTWSAGYFDKDGNEIKNPVAQIEIDGEFYYYESVARATNDAANNSTVTVIADSTETSTLNTTKSLTIQFAESGLGVYSVTGGNFVSADSSSASNFSLTSNRVLSNSNSLLINSGATATVDGYSVTGTSNGYTFALQENSFTLNNISYGGAGTATFDTSGNVSVTSGAIATTTETAKINLAAGSYTINDVEFSATANNTAQTTADGVKFNLSANGINYNSMTFSGAGTVTIQSDTGIYLTGGVIVSNVADGQNFAFSGSGTYKLNNKTIVTLSERPLIVTNTADGLTIGENPFAVTGDDEYRINVDANGKIVSVSNINGGSTIVNAGGADSILTSSAGNFTFGDKTFAIGGDDSVTFRLSSDGAVTKIADVIGTVGGDFTSAININGNAADVLITGDNSVIVTASNIFGGSNNASVIGTGGASIVSTDEEGTFNFYEKQNFSVIGDNSVEFKVNGSVVTGIANFENGTLQVDNANKLSINAEDLTTRFTDTATFIIADSQIVSVDGLTLIDGLSNSNVHATGNVTVNGATVNVTGDDDYKVIVEDSKTMGIADISAGSTVNVKNMNVTTDNNGEFKIGENLYKVIDADNSVTFITGSNGEVVNVTNFSGTLNTNSQNVTVNGATLTTNDTDVTISSAGSNITRIDGLKSGDVLSGAIDSAAVLVTVTSADDVALWHLNNRTYMLTGDSDGVQVTGNRIDGLDNAASLEVSAAGTYLVNNTALDAKIGDTIIGTAEGSAYIFDPNNVPLNVITMTDDEIAAQVGFSTDYSTAETDTAKTSALIESGNLNGNMELALSNSDTTTTQTADFSVSTGKKKITLAEGSQEVKFNDEGGNVAVIESDSVGEKNITLGNGGDLAIIKDTSTPVNITAGKGADTIVTSGNNVTVDMTGGATKIVPNGGNVNLTNYDAATGAGIQVDEVSDIERAVQNGNINFGDGVVSLGGATINFVDPESESTTVNLYDNKGKKQKVAYTHSDGGTINATTERENMLLIGNNNSTKSNGSRLKSGAGNDIAFGGAGDYFDLGSGNNRVYLNSNSSNGSSGATVAMTAMSGKTEVSGFNSGFDDNSDKISINVIGANVSFKNGQLTFSVGNASLILNFMGSSADLAESADILIADNNFIDNDTQLDEITPITYEQGYYQNVYELEKNQDTLSVATDVTFTGA